MSICLDCSLSMSSSTSDKTGSLSSVLSFAVEPSGISHYVYHNAHNQLLLVLFLSLIHQSSL